MKISLLVVGKLKSVGGFKDMFEFYSKRIKNYSQLEIIELKEKKDLESQTELIIKNLPERAFLVALRENGKKFDSRQFSEFLKTKIEKSGHLCFVIGGSYGFNSIKEDISLSIAPWTLPHQLARITLLEQIYRGFSIQKGSNYHHG